MAVEEKYLSTKFLVTNAFRQWSLSGPSPCKTKLDNLYAESPMPFGSDPFRDLFLQIQYVLEISLSPMPFGSDPFRDHSPERGTE